MSSSLTKNQDVADAFRNDPDHLKSLLYIRDLNRLTSYDAVLGMFPLSDDNEYSMRGQVLRYTKAHYEKNITVSMVKDVIEQVKLDAHRSVQDTKSSYISLKDCLFNADTFEYEPFSIDKISFFSLPVSRADIEARRNPAKWNAFLDQIFITKDGQPDYEMQMIVQEMFGYCLLPSCKAEASFFLVGEGANGKSVLLSILSRILGDENCSTLSIEALTADRFMASSLVSKRLNVCTEEESTYLKSDKFKTIVSGERITVQRKFGDSFQVRLNTKFVFATNEMPTFTGFNTGLLRRMIILPCLYTIPANKRDVNLAAKLGEELVDIIAWAFEGAKRLRSQGYLFTQSAATDATRKEFQNNLSGSVMFISQRFIEDEESFISYENLYIEYESWCSAVGRKKQNFDNFKRDIKRISTKGPAVGYDAESGQSVRGRHYRAKTADEVLALED